MGLLESKPCPNECMQGMTLERDYFTPRGEPLDRPRYWYRCNDCPHTEDVGPVGVTYFDADGTLRNADGSRSIFDDVDE